MSEDNDKERRERIKRLRKQDEPESESSISPEELSDQMAQWQRGQLAVTAPIEPGLLVIGQRDEGVKGIQESGRDPISAREVIQMATIEDWQQQREGWKRLICRS